MSRVNVIVRLRTDDNGKRLDEPIVQKYENVDAAAEGYLGLVIQQGSIIKGIPAGRIIEYFIQLIEGDEESDEVDPSATLEALKTVLASRPSELVVPEDETEEPDEE